MNNYPILTSGTFIKGLRIKNRTVMSPMGTNLAESDGSIGDRLIGYYEERAKGGVGLIIPGVISVDYPQGKTIPNQIRLDELKYTKGVANLAEAVHRHDSKLILQIHHAGGLTNKMTTEGLTPVAPCAFPDTMGEPCEALTEEKIQEIISKFIKTASFAEMAGADGIELHGGHSYLISQFLSPVLNQRTDQYGGTEENRRRFLIEIIRGIKATVSPKFIVGARLGVIELHEYGYKLEEGIRIVKAAEKAGLDYVNVTFGVPGATNFSNMIETQKYEEGNRIDYAKAVKDAVNIPVIQAGKIRTPEQSEKFLEEGMLDLVSLGRQFIADPQWINKVSTGRRKEIRKCLSCNDGCLGNLGTGEIRCAINPMIGKEYKSSNPNTVKVSKKVLVIGGGPAGAQAAITAAKESHDVTLVEATGKIGGQLKIASVPPHKEVIAEYAAWLREELDRSGVDVQLGKKVDLDMVKDLKPDMVLVATGSKPLNVKIPGYEFTKNSWTVLDQFTELPENKNISIIGGGIVGCETAELLAEKGNKVTVFEMAPVIASGLESMSLADIHVAFAQYGVDVKTSTTVLEIKESGVVFKDENGVEGFTEADEVIMSIGQTPVRDDLAEAITNELHIPSRYIGDAKEVGKIVDAVQYGYYAGMDV